MGTACIIFVYNVPCLITPCISPPSCALVYYRWKAVGFSLFSSTESCKSFCPIVLVFCFSSQNFFHELSKKNDLPPVQTHAHPISHSCASKSVGINITDWSLMNRSTGIPLKCPGSLQTQGNISWPLNILHRTFTISRYSIASNHILGHNTSHALWSLFLLWWSHITSLWLPLSWDNTLLHLWIKLSPSRLHWVWLPIQFWVILQSQQIPHGTARSCPFCLRCIYKVKGF